MTLRDAFTEHPASVGESYGEHMGVACGFGTRLLLASFACYVHALLPFLFVKTGSRAITNLHERMVLHRQRHTTAGATGLVTRA
jgi:hypothetical protein